MRLKLRLILELELELKQMVVVLIASTNPCKIEAVQSAFQTVSFVFGSEEQVFQDDSFVFHFMSFILSYTPPVFLVLENGQRIRVFRITP